jgi:hypothetical protein
VGSRGARDLSAFAKLAHRDWGESTALLLCVCLFFAFPNRYTIAGPHVMLALGALVGALFALSVYSTLFNRIGAMRVIAPASAVALTFVLVTALAKLVYLVIYKPGAIHGVRLLETALVIWISNVVLFAIMYRALGEKEFQFPRSPTTSARVGFLDYLFLAFTTATAFSPTDTPPLTTRARIS